MNDYEDYNAKYPTDLLLNTWFFTARFVQQQLAENRKTGNTKRQFKTEQQLANSTSICLPNRVQ